MTQKGSWVLNKVRCHQKGISAIPLWLLWKEKNGGQQEAVVNGGGNEGIPWHLGGQSIGLAGRLRERQVGEGSRMAPGPSV